MWPKTVDWKQLKFGVEIEFIGGKPAELELLPGWEMSLNEHQLDETGIESGSELKPPPMLWEERDQIRIMLSRLQAQGATANWSCGLHVHVGLEAWGEQMVLPLLDAALTYQDTLQALLRTSEHRLLFCPPVTTAMRERFALDPSAQAVHNAGRPQSHRCGINTASWFDIGTVEIRYANGSVLVHEVLHTIELCLRFVAAIGAGTELPLDPQQFAAALQAPASGYPASIPVPRWYQERIWLEELLLPFLEPIVQKLVPNGEVHDILPVEEGLVLAIENSSGKRMKYLIEPPAEGWIVKRQLPD
ncbi:amidoligase family protein [Paenibacillus lignilyticus]|uniref:Amidoligase family protein n=1 Tax=Paenibacillus lignilyticus TaxID=1172615 RepID=A0ABS5CAF3_9BACL|nr:amidoligase family protein [Paenibacillus lignilyticus]MBP3962667.1 amidoligase family protein [Paenibacillus lignilyticus]